MRSIAWDMSDRNKAKFTVQTRSGKVRVFTVNDRGAALKLQAKIDAIQLQWERGVQDFENDLASNPDALEV